MPQPVPGALAGYGWSAQVEALYRSHPRPAAARPGRVARVERGAALVIDPDGDERPQVPTGPVAVGDWVVLDGDAPDGEQLVAVLPRWSSLERQDPSERGVHVLATNVDVVLITVPGDRPNPARAERELAVAWQSGARPVVLLTKADLAADGLVGDLAGRLAGAELLTTSAGTGVGVARVADLLAPDRTGVLLGPSGAGKSSLTNALLGEDRQRTGAVRAEDRRGRHVTTSRYLLSLPTGGVIIDTPGLRSLGLVGLEHLERSFPDIDELAGGCRFSDCSHTSEPGCAVAAAVAAGTLPGPRLASYRKLAGEVATGQERAAAGTRGPTGGRRLAAQRAADARRHDDDDTGGGRGDDRNRESGGIGAGAG